MRSTGRGRCVVVLCLALVAGCRCADAPLEPLEPARVEATPERLSFPATFVGHRAQGAFELVNNGGETITLAPSLDTPFSVGVNELTLTRGQAETLVVGFAPTAPGRFTRVLSAGALRLTVEGVGVEVPECVASHVCATSSFDVANERCLEAPRPDGSACETRCVMGGCDRGQCVGSLKGCDDGDACTIDGCGEDTGCSHAPRSCPSVSDPCKVGTCDPTRGCVIEPRADGTLCGPDDCTLSQVDVCITGQCVARQRPSTGRCTNRWVPVSIPGRGAHAMAFDEARERVLLFGGAPGPLGDTWDWDGQRWTLRTPAAAPSARAHHAMAYDPLRRRVVLFGGRDANEQPLGDLWEWDGTTWLRRTPVGPWPSARSEHALLWDPVRARVLLVDGLGVNGDLQDLWEWDGASWTQRTSGFSPPARHGHAIAWDRVRERLVLFGGLGEFGTMGDTWEWDGMGWHDRSTNQPSWQLPAARAFAALGWDETKQRIVLVGGRTLSSNAAGDWWEWDGVYWTHAGTVGYASTHRPMVEDTVRQRLVLFGGFELGNLDDPLDVTFERSAGGWALVQGTTQIFSDSPSMTWDPAGRRLLLASGGHVYAWNGANWFRIQQSRSGPNRTAPAMAWDPRSSRLVFFGGGVTLGSSQVHAYDDTWTWTPAAWQLMAPASSPPGRASHHMVFDASRQELLLFGGRDLDRWLGDMWTWDGATWTTRSAFAPVLEGAAAAIDEARQRVVFFGGSGAETWTWDGAQWQQQAPAHAPSPRTGHLMAWDATRQRIVLFGGESGSTLLTDTWEWDGIDWLQRAPLTSPRVGRWHAMAYDLVRERMVLFEDGISWLFLP